jgi:type IV pilus assembly protein PilE
MGAQAGVERRGGAGFTVLELMFVVAIIAVLVGIAMPSFSKTKPNQLTEVTTVFSDLRTRLERYKLENSAYPASGSELSTWPAAPGPNPQTIFPRPANWVDLDVVMSNETDLYCGYAWVTGRATDPTANTAMASSDGDTGNIGSIAPTLGFVQPATQWYYLIAHCDADGDSTVDAYYVSDSVLTTIRSKNPGS